MRALGVAAGVLAASGSAHADELASSPARPNYEATEKLLMTDRRARLEERGLIVDGTYTTDLFAAPQLDNQLVAGGLFTLEIDAFDRIHISAFAIHGRGVTSELGELHGTSGNAAPEDVRLFEAWYEQPIGPFSVRAGLLAADQEFVVADHASLLLGATFGMTTQFSVNVLGPIYPIAAPAVSATYEHDHVRARIGVFDGTQDNEHGIYTELGGDALVMGEVALINVFKVGGWHHTERGNAGYLIADTDLAPNLDGFARVGYSPAGPIETYIDAGLRTRPSWRPADLVSAGIAFAHAPTGAETHAEVTYEAQVRWVSIQPALQLLFMRDRTVGVMGLRFTLTL